MSKNLLDDGSIKLAANMNWNGYSIINLKELIPQATGAGNIGRWNFRWNCFANIINLPNFNILSTLDSTTGSTSTINGTALQHGVSIPPNDTNIASLNYQSGIFFDDTGQISFKFSQTPISNIINSWDTSVIIDKDGLSADILNLNSLYVNYIYNNSSSGISIDSNISISGNIITNGDITTTAGVYIDGYLKCNVITMSANYDVKSNDCIIFVEIGSLTITLPEVTASDTGRIIIIRNTFGSGSTTISSDSDINGSSNDYTLNADSSVIFAARADGWWSIA